MYQTSRTDTARLPLAIESPAIQLIIFLIFIPGARPKNVVYDAVILLDAIITAFYFSLSFLFQPLTTPIP